MTRTSRRRFLAGMGGVAVGLPFLEGLAPREADADGGRSSVEPFAIFFRQANGVAAEQVAFYGSEPETFWPRAHGPLTPESVAGRSLEELGDHLHRLLVVSNINMFDFEFGDGHTRGALQGLTAQGPTIPMQAGNSEANGESLDHRIGRELNPGGRDSLVLYAGRTGGWLGGPCIAHRGPGNRRAAIRDPMLAYMTLMGLESQQLEELLARQASVNDLVHDQLQTLMASPKLSRGDQRRLQLHFDSVRALEQNLGCTLAQDELMQLEGLSPGYDSHDGDLVLAATRAHMHVAALAVACGHTRAVSIQVGDGNDGTTRYRRLDDGSMMENYHYVSHRIDPSYNVGEPVPSTVVLHTMVDRQFARTFNYLLGVLAAHELPTGDTLLDRGLCLWYNDNGWGPGHTHQNIPTILAGSAGGFLRQGVYLEASGGEAVANHAGLLNTIGSAVGLRDPSGDLLRDFGDPSLDRSPLPELLA